MNGTRRMSDSGHSYLPFSNLNSTLVSGLFVPEKRRVDASAATTGLPASRTASGDSYSTLDKMLVHHRVSPSIEFAKYPFIHWVGTGTERVKCLFQ